MTSISATSGSSNYLSPLQLLQNELQTEVSSGAISSSDQSALSSASNDINSSLQSDGSTGSTGGANAAPGDLKSKIDTLIAGEISTGKLTSAGHRGTELQGVFAASRQQVRADRADQVAPMAVRRPPERFFNSSSGGSPGSSDASTAHDILQQFLQSLQSSLSSSSSSSYSATGSTAASSGNSSFSARLVNYQT